LIKLHRLDGHEIVLNEELIETIQSVPDTLITLTTGNKLVVKESVDAVISLVQSYQRSTLPPPTLGDQGTR